MSQQELKGLVSTADTGDNDNEAGRNETKQSEEQAIETAYTPLPSQPNDKTNTVDELWDGDKKDDDTSKDESTREESKDKSEHSDSEDVEDLNYATVCICSEKMIKFPKQDAEEKEEVHGAKSIFNAGALRRFSAVTPTDIAADVSEDKDIIMNPIYEKCYSCKCDIHHTVSYECNAANKYQLNGQKHIQFCAKCYRQIHELKDTQDDTELHRTKYTEDDPYFFCAKLTKAIYDDCNIGEHQMNNDDILQLKDIKPIWIYNGRSDRVCYASFTMNYLSIDENYETRNAKCDIKMIIRIFWLFDEKDYYNYQQYISSKRTAYEPSWTPQFMFYKGVDASINKDEQSEYGVINVNDFFGAKILKKMLKENKYKSLGYLNYADYHCSLTVNEPFELSSFPFDCQDVPLQIQPTNFGRFAPAFYGNNTEMFIKITGDATDLGVFASESALCEFNNNDTRVRIMIKLKRWWSPYMLKHVFLIFSATILSLSAFSLTVDDKADRLGIVLGLILTLIFIELPDIPIVTILDKYFYGSFSFLVLIAVHCGFADAFEEADDWSTTITFAVVYFCVFLLFQILFIIYSAIVIARENKKINMNSEQISTEVEEQSMNLVCYASTDIDVSEFREVKQIKNCDVFVARPVEEDAVGRLIANQFIKHKRDSELTTSEKVHRWINRILYCVLVVIQFVVSLLLLMNFNKCNTSVINTNIHEIRTIFSFAVIQVFLELIIIYCWNTKGEEETEVGALVFSAFFGFMNYVMCIHQFAIWNPKYVNISCNGDNGDLQNVIYTLCFIWILIPIVMYFIKESLTSTKIMSNNQCALGVISIGNMVYIMMQIFTVILQLMELENVNYYSDCIASNNNDVFINTAETYSVIIFVLFQALTYQLILKDMADTQNYEGSCAAMEGTRLCLGIINWGIIIHSFTFWKSTESSCFDNQNALYSLTLSWIILEIVAHILNCVAMAKAED